jgi:hypothetical protein
MNYCQLSVVLYLTSNWQGSADPVNRVHEQLSELIVFLTAVTFLVMEQRINTKFRFKLSKRPIEIYAMLQTVSDDEALRCSRVFEWFKLSKTALRIIRMIQGACVLQPLEVQGRSQMSVKC